MKNGTINLLLSVIIPVYNGEKTINRAVESILNQPLSDKLEIIIVNDGSKDATKEIIDKIAENNDNVRVFHKENSGVSDTRNLAIEKSTGKYIAFLDADDWWEPNFFDTDICNELEGSNFDLFGFGYNSVSYDCKYIYTRHVENKEVFFEKKGLNRYNWYHFCSFVYKTNFIKNNDLRFLKTKINEDQPFVEMCFYLANGIKYVDKPIFTYWSNHNSCLHTTKIYDYYINKKQAFEIAKKWFKKDGVDYNIKYSMFMIADELTTTACAYDSLKTVKCFFDTQGDSELLLHYNDYPLSKKLYKNTKLWVNCPKIFWMRARLIYRPILDIKNFLYKNKFLRRPFDYIFYVVIKKYKRYK